MNFFYQRIISAAHDSGDFLLLLRPEIPIQVVGSSDIGTYFGLVDTGSDNTILPLRIARDLGIPVRPAEGPPANVFGGYQVQLQIGEATFEIRDEDETFRWRDTVCFFDFPDPDDETFLLGHSGFLDYFTATFDGNAGCLTLVANQDLPAA